MRNFIFSSILLYESAIILNSSFVSTYRVLLKSPVFIFSIASTIFSTAAVFLLVIILAALCIVNIIIIKTIHKYTIPFTKLSVR